MSNTVDLVLNLTISAVRRMTPRVVLALLAVVLIVVTMAAYIMEVPTAQNTASFAYLAGVMHKKLPAKEATAIHRTFASFRSAPAEYEVVTRVGASGRPQPKPEPHTAVRATAKLSTSKGNSRKKQMEATRRSGQGDPGKDRPDDSGQPRRNFEPSAMTHANTREVTLLPSEGNSGMGQVAATRQSGRGGLGRAKRGSLANVVYDEPAVAGPDSPAAPEAGRSKEEEEEPLVQQADGRAARSDAASVDRLVKLSKSYLLCSFTGRLGNALFQLASAVCIAKINGLRLIVKEVPQLRDLNYTGLRLRDEDFERLSRKLHVVKHTETSCCRFAPKLMTMRPSDRSHRVRGYTQSWKYFEPCKNRTKRALLFNDDVVRRAAEVVRSLREKYPGRTLVGVHVRQEDLLGSAKVTNGKKVAPPSYYVKAMTYVRNKFRDVTFVVIASHSGTGRNRVIKPTPDVTFLARSKPAAVDLEVLSRLDHIIISVGTFGWWAGYRNNGTVVCFKDFFVPGSKYGRKLMNSTTDIIYPGWVAL